MVCGELGSLNRWLGRYDIVIEIFEMIFREMVVSECSFELSGEFGVIYWYMVWLEDVKRVLEI